MTVSELKELSESGETTSVTFTMECAGNDRTKMQPQHRVLVVDDEPGLREVLQIVFENSGYAVRTASDVKSAMAALKKLAVPSVKVVRNGQLQELSSRELVPVSIATDEDTSRCVRGIPA